MKDLRAKLIRIAYNNPKHRSDILTIVADCGCGCGGDEEPEEFETEVENKSFGYDEKKASLQKKIANKGPLSAENDISSAIGALNDWEVDLIKRYGDWESIPQELRREMSEIIDLLADALDKVERLSRR